MSEGVNPSQGGMNPGSSPVVTNYFRGGATIAILALFLLLLSFSITNPLIPRTISIVIGIVGVATAFGLIPVRGPQDYYGGLALLIFGTFALIASAELPGQRGFAFGPGTAPRLFAGLLAGLGVAVTIVGVITDGPAIEKYKLRGPIYVIGAICLFALMIRPFGLVLSSFITFILAIMGSTEMKWLESVIASAAMTFFCVLLFVYLLGLPFQLWPQPNAHIVMYSQLAEFLRLMFGPLLKLIFGA
jgi:putative tricarboxylic transport membrane protein